MNNITKSLGVGRSEEETNMSLDIAAHPGRTGTDELVPSRYALRVGEIDVLVISDGVFQLSAATLASNVDAADLAVWLKDRQSMCACHGFDGAVTHFLPASAWAIRLRHDTADWMSRCDQRLECGNREMRCAEEDHAERLGCRVGVAHHLP